MVPSKSNKKVQSPFVAEESVESKPRTHEPIKVSEEIQETAKNAWDQLLRGTGKSVLEQLFGASEQQLVEGQEILLEARKAEAKAQKTKSQITAEFMEYRRSVIDTEGKQEARIELELKRAVDEIRAEIKKLAQTSKLVERTVKDATAEQAPVRPGKYHLSFFEFVLGVIRDATRKLEDTVHFGAIFTTKKQQSVYWKKYKKHGTQFGLSGERTTATQTG